MSTGDLSCNTVVIHKKSAMNVPKMKKQRFMQQLPRFVNA